MRDFILYTGAIGIFIAFIIIWLIRKDQMHVRYSLWWIVLAAGVMILGWFPNLIDRVGNLVGVAYPPALLFVLALVVLLVKSLLSDIDHSKAERRILRLTQRLVILESRVRELEGTNMKVQSGD
jgi:hypothetical protein